MSNQGRLYTILIVVTAVSMIILVFVLGLLVADVFSSPPSAVVASATVPTATPLLGEVGLYRFTLEAKDEKGIKVEEIYFSSDPKLFLQNPQLQPYLFDNDTSDKLAGIFDNHLGLIRYRPIWPIIISKGDVKTFGLRGTVAWPGTVSVYIKEVVLETGIVAGTPTAATTITVGGQREQGR